MATPSPDQDATARIDSDVRTPYPRSAQAQFAPGTMIAGRYRIAGILGSGGMGEVYRADDTKLDQPVALKFLPARLARDPILLGRLHDEVRLGRQIAHPNVCRIYDIVDWEGAQFVAMEFVDGEDLSRLLRRIGRLAHDKAVDIARGIAAGLLAAHAKGILHRDLKPANIMVDSHGEARIMDFGLALAAGEDDGTVSGTPAYMAPEQLEGQQATIQSDLYALGLVMYELFTGKRAHNARTLPERVRDITSEITTPSDLIRDLDPAVERLILRCLSNDPMQRPRSVREVVEALPGGDPLAAALAAGETPSPGLVAAAGTQGSLSRAAAWSLLGTAGVLLALSIYVREQRSLGKYTPPMRSPEVLHDRATAMLRAFDVPAHGSPIAGFVQNNEYYGWLSKPDRWEPLRRGPAMFAYRLEYGVRRQESDLMPRTATAPGRASIEIDGSGRLLFLQASPRGEVEPRPLDWNALLTAAGLDPSAMRPAPARFIPAAPADALRSWSGTYPGDRTPIRVEAGAWRGVPTFFRITGPWDEAANPLGDIQFSTRRAAPFVTAVIVILFAASVLLAWRNLRLRRGDRQGALRIAALVFVCELGSALLWRVSLSDPASILGIFTSTAGDALFVSAALYLFYVALEPFIRRRWPTLLIGWTRLASGRVRDPMVGRDVMIGIIGGLGHTLVAGGTDLVLRQMQTHDGGPETGVVSRLLGLHHAVGHLLAAVSTAITQGLAVAILLVVLTMILRRRALAGAGLFLVILTIFVLAIAGAWEVLPFVVLLSATLTFIVVRYGVLAITVTQLTFMITFFAPHVSASWAVPTLVCMYGAVALLALWAFRTSLGGQSLLGEDALGD
jgi:tRNA A-37 threonylcarbamoyl transferase component Bud32